MVRDAGLPPSRRTRLPHPPGSPARCTPYIGFGIVWTLTDMRRITYPGIVAILGILFVAVMLFFLGSNKPASEWPTQASVSEEAAPPETVEDKEDKYGLIAGDYDVIDRKVRRNETFGEILTGHNIPYAKVLSVSDSGKDVFDVRRIQAGKPLRVYSDSVGGTYQARYIVYEQDRLNYVVFDLAADSASSPVYAGKRHGKIKRQHVSGRIAGSLYRTLENGDTPANIVPPLALALSEVFAWQVDFFRVRPGDDFNVVYDVLHLDDEPIRVEKIVAARFGHLGTDYFGFLFEEGERPDYYDEHGKSLRKQLLQAPLKFDRISSRYSKRRFHPVQKRYKAHLGTDYAAAPGTPIYSTGDGTVLEAQFKRYNGNYVKIRHNSVYTTGYLHMSRIASGIRPGTRVRQGQVIGYVGSTGLATGPHVCYRYWKNDVQIDPYTDTLPPAGEVAPEQMERFALLRNEIMPLIAEDPRSYIAESDAQEDERPSNKALL